MSLMASKYRGGRGVSGMSGSLTGSGTLTIPPGVLSVSITGAGGAGGNDYVWHDAIPAVSPSGWVPTTYQWTYQYQDSGSDSGPAYAWTSLGAAPTGLGQNKTIDRVTSSTTATTYTRWTHTYTSAILTNAYTSPVVITYTKGTHTWNSYLVSAATPGVYAWNSGILIAVELVTSSNNRLATPPTSTPTSAGEIYTDMYWTKTTYYEKDYTSYLVSGGSPAVYGWSSGSWSYQSWPTGPDTEETAYGSNPTALGQVTTTSEIKSLTTGGVTVPATYYWRDDGYTSAAGTSPATTEGAGPSSTPTSAGAKSYTYYTSSNPGSTTYTYYVQYYTSSVLTTGYYSNPGSAEIPGYASGGAFYGPSTTASLNGVTESFTGGFDTGVVGTPSTRPMASHAQGQTLTYSVGAGGYINYEYEY